MAVALSAPELSSLIFFIFFFSDPATAAAALLATVSNGEAAWRHQMRHGDVRGGRACTRAQRGGVFGATTKQTSSCVTDNLRVLDGREMTCALHQTE